MHVQLCSHLALQIRQSVYNWRRGFLNVALSIVKERAELIKEKFRPGGRFATSTDAIAAWATKAIMDGGEAHWEFPISDEVSRFSFISLGHLMWLNAISLL